MATLNSARQVVPQIRGSVQNRRCRRDASRTDGPPTSAAAKVHSRGRLATPGLAMRSGRANSTRWSILPSVTHFRSRSRHFPASWRRAGKAWPVRPPEHWRQSPGGRAQWPAIATTGRTARLWQPSFRTFSLQISIGKGLTTTYPSGCALFVRSNLTKQQG